MTAFRMTNLDMMADPDYLDVRARFWQPSIITTACAHCGDPFSYVPEPQQRRKYCSDDCRMQAHHAAERHARLDAALKRMKAMTEAA